MSAEAEAPPAGENTKAEIPPKRPAERRSGSIPKRLGQVILGLGVGLLLAEGLFWMRDDGAFPHLNVYVADPKLGVRLKPGASQKIAFGGSPVTSVRINASGLRGADLPPPSGDEIIVIGDSQVFGLGVEETETASAELSRKLKRQVINAGVPTYGPPEYNAALEEILAARKPKIAVYVVNFSNDFFEAVRPNTERHATWDGWAVRKETAPLSITSFPGRDFLFNRSHAVYALRRYWYQARHPQADDRGGLPSEGTANDLLGNAANLEPARAQAHAETARRAALRRGEIRFAEQRAEAAAITLEASISTALVVQEATSYSVVGPTGPGITYRSVRANPGDIVAAAWGEEGRDTVATAKLIREGAILRSKFEAEIRKRAEGDPAKYGSIVKLIEERDRADSALTSIRAAPLEIARAHSPIVQQIEKAKAICDAHGARLVVVGLPLDVMVFSSAWAKYGSEPVDLSPAAVLMADLLHAAEALGVTALDATPALREAGEAAFLPREFHLTPAGHKALANAIAGAIDARPPLPEPQGLPPGRSPFPRLNEWPYGEIAIAGSTAAGCETKRIREYFSIRCAPKSGSKPLGGQLIKGGQGDAVLGLRGEVLTLIAPVVPGEELIADLSWSDRTQRLVIRWPAGDIVFDAFFEPKRPPVPPPAAEPGDSAACACHREVNPAASSCERFLGDASAACAATYKGQCKDILACSFGDPLAIPACPEGQISSGALGRCRPLCSSEVPCATGSCLSFGGGGVCVTP